MPVLGLNGSAYTSTSHSPVTIFTSVGPTNATQITDQYDPAGNPLVYILAVLSFYVLTITLLMIKSIHGDREEKNYEYYYQNFIKRDRVGDRHGYIAGTIKPVQPKSKTRAPQKAQSNAPVKPARTAMKQPNAPARPKETVRLVEPGGVDAAVVKKSKKLAHKKSDSVMMTSV